MSTLSNIVARIRLRDAKEIIRKFPRQQNGLIVAVVLLIIMTGILSLPTIKPLRTVEINSKNRGELLLKSDMPIAQNVLVPAGKLAYFVLWVQEGHGSDKIKTSDYKAMGLEVRSQNGQVIRTSAEPKFIKKNDEPALLFGFDHIVVDESERYTFVTKQASNIIVQQPIPDNIKEGETIVAAFQLGEKRNWLTLLIDKVYKESLVGKDVSSYLHRGIQILHGENPYACVLENDSCVGYPAHLPGMYLVAAGFVKMGVDQLDEWTHVWRPIVFAAWFGVGLILFVYIFRRGQPALAVAAFGFWLFNRWSIDVLRIAHTDFIGVFFLLLSVVLAGFAPFLAAFLLGVSLAVKQLAVLIVPIFLINAWRQKKFKAVKLGVLTGLILLAPLVTSLPFLINNPKATVRGWINVVERPSQVVHGFAPSLDTWLDVTQGKSLLMLFLIGAVYVAAYRKEVNLTNGTLIVMAITMAFTSVLYNQYFVWLIPFIPLAIANMRNSERNDKQEK
jgi:hypothetical protein